MTPRSINLIPYSDIKAVFTDLDGTLTEEPLVLPETYSALWKLREKGIWLVVVSGRPAGAADAIMKLWPIDAMVYENGAGIFHRRNGRLVNEVLTRSTGSDASARLRAVFEKVKRVVPEASLAGDQPFRLFDFSIDYNEEPPFLDETQTRKILEILSEEPGITAKMSSVHINYCAGDVTKRSACEHLLATVGAAKNIRLEEIVYVGDAPNDEPLFDFFPNSVGVSNVAKYFSQMKSHPKYLCQLPAGRGFQEVAEKIAASRHSTT